MLFRHQDHGTKQKNLIKLENQILEKGRLLYECCVSMSNFTKMRTEYRDRKQQVSGHYTYTKLRQMQLDSKLNLRFVLMVYDDTYDAGNNTFIVYAYVKVIWISNMHAWSFDPFLWANVMMQLVNGNALLYFFLPEKKRRPFIVEFWWDFLWIEDGKKIKDLEDDGLGTRCVTFLASPPTDLYWAFHTQTYRKYFYFIKFNWMPVKLVSGYANKSEWSKNQ